MNFEERHPYLLWFSVFGGLGAVVYGFFFLLGALA